MTQDDVGGILDYEDKVFDLALPEKTSKIKHFYQYFVFSPLTSYLIWIHLIILNRMQTKLNSILLGIDGLLM